MNLHKTKDAKYGPLLKLSTSVSLGKNIGRKGKPKRDKIPKDKTKFSLDLTPYRMQPSEEAYLKKYQLKISIFKQIRRIPVEVILEAPISPNRDLWFIARRIPAPILRSRRGKKSSTQKSLSM